MNKRVSRVAEAVLARQQYVSAIATQPGAYRVIRVVARATGKRKLFARTRSGYIAGGESRPVKDEGAK